MVRQAGLSGHQNWWFRWCLDRSVPPPRDALAHQPTRRDGDDAPPSPGSPGTAAPRTPGKIPGDGDGDAFQTGGASHPKANTNQCFR